MRLISKQTGYWICTALITAAISILPRMAKAEPPVSPVQPIESPQTVGVSQKLTGHLAPAEKSTLKVKIQSALKPSQPAVTPVPSQNIIAPADTSMSAASINESGEGSIQALSSSSNLLQNQFPAFSASNVDVSLQLGNAFQSIPLETPPGVNNIQPDLKLVYSSNSQNGFYGVGWDIPLGAIERSTKRGIPKYNDNLDEFILIMDGGSRELTFDSTQNYYRTKTEDAFLKIEHLTSPDRWVVTNKEGTKFYFGLDADARQSNGANIFKWLLSKVEDVHGNFMTVTYFKDTTNLEIYPDTIDYTGNPNTALSTFAKVRFLRQNRSVPFTSYRAGFKVKTTLRIDKIVVEAGTQTQREYDLTYGQSSSTLRDLLTSVTQYGKGGVNTLPPIAFTYYSQKGYFNDTNAVIPSELVFAAVSGAFNIDFGVRFEDVNSDGYPDMVQNYRDLDFLPNGINRTYLNNGDNSWSFNANYNMPQVCKTIISETICTSITGERQLQPPSTIVNIDYGVRFADVNSDGYNDIIEAKHDAAHRLQGGSYLPLILEKTQHTFLNTGATSNAWTADQSNWHLPVDQFFYSGFIHYLTSGGQDTLDFYRLTHLGNQLVDVNNDGYVDFVTAYKAPADSDHAGIAIRSRDVYLNNLRNGTAGWSLDAAWQIPDSPYTDFLSAAVLIDLNGDNLPDIYYNDGTTTNVFMNTGANWVNDTSSNWKNSGGYGNLLDGSTQFADINADGLADMIIAKGSQAAGSRVIINTGDGWADDTGWIFPEGDFRNYGTRILDANADNMPDFMIHFNGVAPKLYINDGLPADILYKINNNSGGETTVLYGSTHGVNTHLFLPFPLTVVAEVEQKNNLGSVHDLQYGYANGFWVPQERELRSFGDTITVNPEYFKQFNKFYQDKFRDGKLIFQQINSLADQPLSIVNEVWLEQTIPTASGARFVLLDQRLNITYNQSLNYKIIQEKYSYEDNSPQYGNLTKVEQLGEVFFNTSTLQYEDIPNTDKRETQFQYHAPTSNYVVGLPKIRTVKGFDGQDIRKTWFYYDNNNSNNNAVPVKGLLTKQEEWAGGAINDAQNPKTEYTYNLLGNVLTAKDPRGTITQTVYDTQYGVFPKTTNILAAATFTVSREFYGVDGIDQGLGTDQYYGLWGQLKTTADYNNNAEKKSYDEFGRLVKVVSPLDTLSLPTTEITYQYGTNHLQVTTASRVKTAETPVVNEYEYIDGLGRRLMTLRNSLVPDEFFVFGRTEYDSRGQAVKTYNPYTDSNPIVLTDPVDPSVPFAAAQYDELGRVIRKDNPDGTTFSTVNYDLWTVETIDENNHKSESDLDAYGRLIEKRDYTGNSAGTYAQYNRTTYVYDSEGNLKQVKAEDAVPPVTTTINYNKLGLKINMTDPDMGMWEYSYDLNGNLVYQKDGKEQEINFSYDQLNRLTRKWDDDVSPTLNNIYVYDDAGKPNRKGRLSSVSYIGGSKEYEYDKRGRTLKVIEMIDTQSFITETQYDALGNVTMIKYPDGSEVHYKYNAIGQLEEAAEDPALFDQSFLNNPGEDLEQYAMASRDKSHDTSHKSQERATDHGTQIAGSGSRSTFLGKIAAVFEEYVLGVKPAYAQAMEDFTTYTEVDPQSKITRTTDCVSFTNIETQNSASYVYKSKTTTGDFVHDFDTILSASDFTSGETAVWGISNNLTTYDLWSSGAFLAWYKSGSTTIRLELETKSPAGSDNSVNLSLNQRYYVRVTRTGTSLTAQIYSDPQRTTLVDTLTRAFNNTAFTYLYGFSNDTWTATGHKATGDACRLSTAGPDTQAPTVPTGVNFTSPTSSSLQLNWTASTDNVAVTGYRIDVATDSGFTSMVSGYNNKDVFNVVTASVTGLNPSTTYYARVRAYDAVPNTSASSTPPASGTTSAAPDTQAPTVPTGVNFTSPTSSSLQLNWTASTDNVAVTGYRIDVATDSGFTSMVSGYNNKDVFNVVTASVTGLNPSTTYYARVRAYDAVPNTSASSTPPASGTTSAAPDTQAPTVPTGVNFTSPTSSSLQLNWTASTDNVAVTGYRIDVATDSGFTSMVSGYNNKDVFNVVTASVTGLNPSTTYYARVRAYDAVPNTSASSTPPASGTTSAAPDTQAPTVPTGVNFTSPTSSSLQLNWTASTDNVAVMGYRIDVATDSGFTNMVSGYNNKDVFNVVTASVTGLNPSTTYYAQVRAYDAVPNTSASSTPPASGTTASGILGNFNSFIEADPQVKIIRTADCVYFTNIELLSSASYVYKTYTTSGDFVYEFDTILTAADFAPGSGVVWGITNTPANTFDQWSSGAFLNWYKSGSTTIRLELETKSPAGSDNSVNLSLNQRYYIRVTRTGTTLTAQIYSNPARTTLVDTLTRAFNNTTFSHIYAFSNDTGSSTGKKVTGDVCNLSAGLGAVDQRYVKDVLYFPSGLIKKITYGNNVVTDYTYDANLRLQTMVTTDSALNEIQNLAYAYDNAGNVFTISDDLTGEVKEYTYDELNRLKTAAGNYNNGQYTTLTYAYNKVGNLTSKEGDTFMYGENGYGPHAITSTNTDTFTYDLNGNMLQHVGGGITRNFEYDIENQLKTYKHGTSTIASYTYDEAGERNKKTVAQSGITTRYTGDLYEEDTTGAEVQHIFAGSTRVASIAPTGIKYTHGDHLGSRSVVTDVDGLEVDHIDYKPFGEINRHDAVASEEGPHFTDQYRDDETELYYYNSRYYNPKVGRFVQPDSVVPGADNSQAFNRYSYVFNNPLRFIDPTGNVPGALNDFDFISQTSSFGLPKFNSVSNSGLTFLDKLQLGLGAFGLTEPFGFLGDIGSGIISLAQRDFFGAGIDGLSALPGIGLFARGADLANTGIKATKTISTGSEALFSSNSLSGVERASDSLLEAVGQRRTITFATEGSDALRFLNVKNAEAAAFGANDILLRTTPSKAAVLEEFLHGTQQKLGIIDKLGRQGAESHVKDFMIRHQKFLQLTPDDVGRLKTLKDAGL